MCRDINEMRLTKMIYIVEVILVSIIVFNFSHEWMSPEEPKQFVGSKMPKRTIIHGIIQNVQEIYIRRHHFLYNEIQV